MAIHMGVHGTASIPIYRRHSNGQDHDLKTHENHMSKRQPKEFETATDEGLSFATSVAILLLLAEKYPHWQFNSKQLSKISGVGRTAMTQIRKASDTPFSMGKCTPRRLDAWLEKHPGYKQTQWSSAKRDADSVAKGGGSGRARGTTLSSSLP
jgi:hypothetical protein